MEDINSRSITLREISTLGITQIPRIHDINQRIAKSLLFCEITSLRRITAEIISVDKIIIIFGYKKNRRFFAKILDISSIVKFVRFLNFDSRKKKRKKREREEVFHKINILNNPRIPRTMYIVRKRVIIPAEWGNH